MITLYHAPQSRSSRVIWLLEELGAPYEIKKMNISRMDGSGGVDPNNPHPEGKVPSLSDDGGPAITESAAIFLYLTDRFPQNGIGPQVGDPQRGPYLTWLAYYAGVIEPVINLEFAGLADNPMMARTFRTRKETDARIASALKNSPYLLGEKFSAADILIGSLGGWMRTMFPPGPEMDAYLKRIQERPAAVRARAKDA